MVYGERPQNKIEVVSNHLRVFPLQKGACKYKILDGSHQRGFLNKIYHTSKINTMKAFYNYFRQKFTSYHIKLVNKSYNTIKVTQIPKNGDGQNGRKE